MGVVDRRGWDWIGGTGIPCIAVVFVGSLYCEKELSSTSNCFLSYTYGHRIQISFIASSQIG
jgi:hypothetical protein